MPKNNKQLLRRQFLRSGLISGLALLTGVGVLLGKGAAAGGLEVDAQMIRQIVNLYCS